MKNKGMHIGEIDESMLMEVILNKALRFFFLSFIFIKKNSEQLNHGLKTFCYPVWYIISQIQKLLQSVHFHKHFVIN